MNEPVKDQRHGHLPSPDFVAKPSGNLETAAAAFGADQAATAFWLPHICGICCLKMVGDTHGKTTQMSLNELTIRCVELGGFTHLDTVVRGVFHKPLVELAMTLGMSGAVERRLTVRRVRELLQAQRYVLLSIDLARAETARPAEGSHLVLVFGYDADCDEYELHDSSSVLAPSGERVVLRGDQIDLISNQRGLWLTP